MKNLSIRARLYLGSAIAVVLLVATAAVGLMGISDGAEALRNVFNRQVLPNEYLNSINADLKEIRFRMAGYLSDVMPAAGSKNQIIEARRNIPKAWNLFKQNSILTDHTADSQKLVEDIDKHLSDLDTVLAHLEQGYDQDKKATIQDILEMDWAPIEIHVLNPVARLIPLQDSLIEQKVVQAKGKADQYQWIVGGAIAFASILLLLATSQITRSMQRNLKKIHSGVQEVAAGDLTVRFKVPERDELGQMADSLNEMVSRLAGIAAESKQSAETVREVSQRILGLSDNVLNNVTTQVSGILQVNTAIEEMSYTINDVASNSAASATSAHHAGEVVRHGYLIVEDTAASLDRIDRAVQVSSDTVATLQTAITKISSVTKVINEIAEQTNLLALNAAIEAARAGDQGRGFAVVADEVRSLSKRTSESTAHIVGIVSDIESATNNAVEVMKKARGEVEQGVQKGGQSKNALEEIQGAVEVVSEKMVQIATVAEEQSATAEEIARTMNQVYSVSEETKTDAGSTREAIQQMSATAESLQASVSAFHI